MHEPFFIASPFLLLFRNMILPYLHAHLLSCSPDIVSYITDMIIIPANYNEKP
jgi:hypothetical protein